MGFGFSTGFDIFGVMFTLIFVLFIGVFVLFLVKGISRWNKNNHSPRLIVPATIVSKRTDVSHHHHSGDGMHNHYHTSYYVTSKWKVATAWSSMWKVTSTGCWWKAIVGSLLFRVQDT